LIVSVIVAMDENRGIGFQNRLPWRLSSDLKRFKSLTLDHHVIMGRKTFESIGKLLPGRKMIVISRTHGYQAPGCYVAHSLDEAINFAKNEGEEEAFMIGGAAIYKAVLPFTDRLYLTLVHASTTVDAFFPEVDEGEWNEVQRIDFPADEKNQYPTTYQILNKRTIRI
jgi:dihydrofolate reductase